MKPRQTKNIFRKVLVKHKKCKGCGETKAVEFFYRIGSTKDGYEPKCIECSKKDKKRKKAEPYRPKKKCRYIESGPKQKVDRTTDLLDKCGFLKVEFKWECCGIYILSKNGKIVYVGQSTRIIERLLFHARNSSKNLNTKDFDAFHIIPVSENKLNQVEGALIRYYRPKFNRSIFNGSILAPRCGVPFSELEEHDLKIIRRVLGQEIPE